MPRLHNINSVYNNITIIINNISYISGYYCYDILNKYINFISYCYDDISIRFTIYYVIFISY